MKQIKLDDQCLWRDRKHLPEVSAVYFLLYGDTILYVGSTGNLLRRWGSHGLNRTVAREFSEARIGWQIIQSDNLRAVERDYIKTLSPALNGHTQGRVTARMTVQFSKEEVGSIEREIRIKPALQGRTFSDAVRWLIHSTLGQLEDGRKAQEKR